MKVNGDRDRMKVNADRDRTKVNADGRLNYLYLLYIRIHSYRTYIIEPSVVPIGNRRHGSLRQRSEGRNGRKSRYG